MSIAPEGSAGLNTIRGVLGGLFLACVAMLLLGAWTGERTWWFAVSTVMLAVAFGRVVGIVFDGFVKAVLPPLVVEMLIAGALLAISLALP